MALRSKAFGFEPIELTEIIVRDTEMPSGVVNAMVPLPPREPDEQDEARCPGHCGLG
ncbi:MAG: hypothetical protein ACLFU4_09565 [Opitutales bacterium]